LPILAKADDALASNWVWQLPPPRSSFGAISAEGSSDFAALLNARDPCRNGIAYPHQVVVPVPDPTARAVEGAELINAIKMQQYREQCELLKREQLQGRPASYPTQIPIFQGR